MNVAGKLTARSSSAPVLGVGGLAGRGQRLLGHGASGRLKRATDKRLRGQSAGGGPQCRADDGDGVATDRTDANRAAEAFRQAAWATAALEDVLHTLALGTPNTHCLAHLHESRDN